MGCDGFNLLEVLVSNKDKLILAIKGYEKCLVAYTRRYSKVPEGKVLFIKRQIKSCKAKLRYNHNYI